MARSAGAPGLARYARSQVSAIFARATSELIVNSTLPHERHTVLSMATDAFLPFPRGSWFMPYEPPLSRFVRRSSLPHFIHSAKPASLAMSVVPSARNLASSLTPTRYPAHCDGLTLALTRT
jgi:hypothetical protein